MRYGWLDLPLLRRALMANPPTDWLAVSCLDQLSGLPEIRVCLTHDAVGNPGSWQLLPAWRRSLANCRRLTDLPKRCRQFLDFLASPSGLDTPIGLIAVGPTADDRLYLL
jgi:adenylosuccinate synthase